ILTAGADADLVAGENAVPVPVVRAERLIVAAPLGTGDDAVAVGVHRLKTDAVAASLRHCGRRQAEAEQQRQGFHDDLPSSLKQQGMYPASPAAPGPKGVPPRPVAWTTGG